MGDVTPGDARAGQSTGRPAVGGQAAAGKAAAGRGAAGPAGEPADELAPARDQLWDGVRELLTAVRLLRQDRGYGRVGVPSGLVGLLLHIEHVAGATDAGCHGKDLAGQLDLDPSTVSRAVSAMVGLGLVERRGDPADRRASTLVITPAGHAALAEARQWYAQVFSGALGGWRLAEIEAFTADLRRFSDDLRSYLGHRQPDPAGAQRRAGAPTTGDPDPTGRLEAHHILEDAR